MDGGALSWDETLNLEAAIDDALSQGRGQYVAKGKTGIVLKVSTDAMPFTDTAKQTRVQTIVVKVVPLHDMLTPKVEFRGTKESSVRKEFKRQKWLDEASIRKYGFSIFPTPIFYKTTTLHDLASKFPFFGKLLDFWEVRKNGRIGVIFMELANSNGKAGTMSESRLKRAEPLGRRLLFMLAMLGYIHGDFHKGNFFQSGRGFVIGDLGEARPLTTLEREKLTAFIHGASSKREIIKLLYGLDEPGRDFTSQYYHPIPGDDTFNGYVRNYQWVRTDDSNLSTAVDDVEFATVKEVRQSLGFSSFTRRKR